MKSTIYWRLFVSKSLFLVVLLGAALPSRLFSQKVILTKVQNTPDRFREQLDVHTFFYQLEEGVQSVWIYWAEGYTIPVESLHSWACMYRSLFYSGAWKRDDQGRILGGVDRVTIQTENPHSDSVIIEQIFLEILPGGSLDIQLVVRFVEVQSQVVEANMYQPESVEGISVDDIRKKIQEQKEKQTLITLDDLPPPPPMRGEAEEKARHQKAAAKIKCN